MKTFFLITILCLPILALGQEGNFPPFIIESVNVMPPVFSALKHSSTSKNYAQSNSVGEYLNKSIQYPERAVERSEQGTVVVRFIVNTSGELTDFNVVNSISPSIDQQVIDVLKSTDGMWNPGSRNNLPVDMSQEISVIFKLHDSYDFVLMAKKYLKKGNELLFIKNRPEKAMPYLDNAIKLLPYNETLHAIRGYCKFKLGNENDALSDWLYINNSNKQKMIEYFNQLSEEKDIAELIITSELK